jgi:hypothetical protein
VSKPRNMHTPPVTKLELGGSDESESNILLTNIKFDSTIASLVWIFGSFKTRTESKQNSIDIHEAAEQGVFKLPIITIINSYNLSSN